MYNVQCSYLPKCGSRLWIQIKHRLDLEHRYIQFMHAKLSLINLIYIKNSLYIRLSSHIVVNWRNLWTFFMLWFSQALTELRSAHFKSAPVILRTIYATWQPSASEVFVEPAQRKTVVVFNKRNRAEAESSMEESPEVIGVNESTSPSSA